VAPNNIPTGLASPASSSWPARILEQCPVSALHTSGGIVDRQKNPATNLAALVDVQWVSQVIWHQKKLDIAGCVSPKNPPDPSCYGGTVIRCAGDPFAIC